MALERVESQHVCFMGKPRIWKFGKIPGKFVQGLKSSISVQRKKKVTYLKFPMEGKVDYNNF